jgi:hypothetical protein
VERDRDDDPVEPQMYSTMTTRFIRCEKCEVEVARVRAVLPLAMRSTNDQQMRERGAYRGSKDDLACCTASMMKRKCMFPATVQMPRPIDLVKACSFLVQSDADTITGRLRLKGLALTHLVHDQI